MQLLRWLQKQKELADTLGLYCELARKFLIEGKPTAAKFLLTQHLQTNLSEKDRAVIAQKEKEVR